jgi:hypothetical protein
MSMASIISNIIQPTLLNPMKNKQKITTSPITIEPATQQSQKPVVSPINEEQTQQCF